MYVSWLTYMLALHLQSSLDQAVHSAWLPGMVQRSVCHMVFSLYRYELCRFWHSEGTWFLKQCLHRLYSHSSWVTEECVEKDLYCQVKDNEIDSYNSMTNSCWCAVKTQSTLSILSVGQENLSSMDMSQATTWPRDQ